MSLKHYSRKLNIPDEIEEGKTYHKDKLLTLYFAELLDITIVSHSGGVVTATMGKDTFIQTLTPGQAMDYINAQGGYSDSP